MSVGSRLPKRLWLCDQLVTVRLVTAEELRDVVADQDGADGAWDVDTLTIYVLRTLPPSKRSRVFAHELIHACVDLLDR